MAEAAADAIDADIALEGATYSNLEEYEDKLENRGATKPETKLAPREEEEEDEDTVTTSTPNGPRRRRRRRGGARQHNELPGNRGKHLVGGGDDSSE